MKTTKRLSQVKDCGTSGKRDNFDLFAELRKNQTALVCLLNVWTEFVYQQLKYQKFKEIFS